MLRIIPNSSEAGAKAYYTEGLSRADYYVRGQEVVGRWGGKGAEMLGLSGTISKDDFFSLCENRNPTTGQRLTARTNDSRRVGYDFNFHVPKSVSAMYALTGDARILEAFRRSVDQTMTELETEAKARVRRGGASGDRITGNLIWGEFVHFTARPVDGVPDPHLHAHCFTLNATFDAHPDERRWKAAEVGGIKRDASYFEAGFHSRLAKAVSDLGYGIRHTEAGWEIAGVPDSVLEKFSRRTQVIDAKAEALGIDDPSQKDKLGAKTREKKKPELSDEDLRRNWRERLTDTERHAIQQAAEKRTAPTTSRRSSREGVEHALEHCFERKSVVSDKELLAEALWHSMGVGTVAETRADLANAGALERLVDGRTLMTTKAVLNEERSMLNFASKGRGVAPRLAASEGIRDAILNEGQRAAVRHVWKSHDRVILIRGKAGTGKTTMMKEAVRGLEAVGHRVLPLAPTAEAARDVLRSEGFKSADTVARFLQDEELQESARGGVVWVDEAGLLGTPTAAKLFKVAERLGSRVVLMGDSGQHAAVERGDALRLLESEAGLVAAEVRDIQRQKGDYKAVVDALAKGDMRRGLAMLDSMGAIREHAGTEGSSQLATDYVAALGAGRTALIVSPTHALGAEVTAAVRQRLREHGELAAHEQSITSLVSERFTEAERRDTRTYKPGQVVVFHANARGYRRSESISLHRVGRDPLATIEVPERGIKKGERLMVTEVTDDKVFVTDVGGRARMLPIHEAGKFDVFRQQTVAIAPGDRVRFTRNARTRDGRHELRTGMTARVKGFMPDGHLSLDNGWVVDRQHGHLTHGYVVTSHASQGKTVDSVFIAENAASLAAASAEQFYVSVSRGRREVRIYTDDKASLERAVAERTQRMSSVELVRRHAGLERGEDRWDRLRQHAVSLVRKAVQAQTQTIEKVRDFFRESVRTR